MKENRQLTRREALGAIAGAALVNAGAQSRADASASPEPGEPFLLSSTGCGRATGYAESNKIVTLDGRTHVAWLDSVNGKFLVKMRTLDRQRGEWSRTTTVGDAKDNHGGPALTVDSKGILHIAYGPHHHPMQYRRSKRPNDASEWSAEERIGTKATYPTLVCGPDDTLYLTYRVSGTGPWHVHLCRKRPSREWEKPFEILEANEGGYSHFQEALAFSPDGKTLHLSCRFYGGKTRRGHTVSYLRSVDGGTTWTRSDGAAVTLPATAETAEAIARAPKGVGYGLRCGSITVDPKGRPLLLHSYYDDVPIAAWISRLDSPGNTPGKWTTHSLLPKLPKEWKGHGLTLPGGLCFDAKGRLFVALTRIRPPDGADETVWGHPSSEVALLVSEDDGESFDARLLSRPDDKTPHWLPNIERPTGHHRVTTPVIIFTDGVRGDNNRQVISNRVWWVQPSVG
jgi:hypothetical protein